MPTITRAPLARHLAAAVAAGALVLAPTTAALADPTPSPTVTATASPSPTASVSETPTPDETGTEAPSPTSDSSSVPTTIPAGPTTQPTASPSAPDTAKDATKAESGLVPGGTSRAFGLRAAAAGPATSTDAALLGAHYLEQRLIQNDHLIPNDFGPDYGLTADAILALDAAGTGQDAATAATAKLAADPVAYTGFGNPSEVYAGATSKLLNVAVAQKVDPTAFGGVNLIASLKSLEDADGRFKDISEYGDYSNTFGQSLAVIGLSRAGAGSAKAVDFLEAQQCPNGGFQLGMGTSGCTDDTLAGSESTSMAIQALAAVGGDQTVINDALDYLTGQQQADGGVGGSGQESATNANSTGLAGQAFLAGGRSAQSRLAVSYLTPLQYGCEVSAVLRGGIAYNAQALSEQRAAGEDAAPEDQDNRSTAQSLLALAGTPLGTVTSSGADAVAPEPECPAPSPSPSASASASATPSATASTSPTSGSGSSTTSASPAAGGGSTTTGSLAQTGSDLWLPVALGALLVVLGAAAVISSRRRGAHA